MSILLNLMNILPKSGEEYYKILYKSDEHTTKSYKHKNMVFNIFQTTEIRRTYEHKETHNWSLLAGTRLDIL